MEKDIEEVLNMVEKPEFDKNDTSEQLIFKYLNQMDANKNLNDILKHPNQDEQFHL